MKKLIFVALCLAICCAIAGCAQQTTAISEDETPNTQADSGTHPSSTVYEQIATITGVPDRILEPLPGAEEWAGGEGIGAFVDPETHDEFIVDLNREMLLAFDEGSHIFEEPGLAPYEGEPSRAEMIALADKTAREQIPERDISSMRRTAWRRVCGIDTMGDTLEYQVNYRRYDNGVQVPEWASVTIFLPSWTWTPSTSVHDGRSEDYDTPPFPEVSMLEAYEAAIGAAGFAECRVKELSLTTWNGMYFWSFDLENLNVPENSFGSHGAWVRIDALTGECLEVGRCG